MWFHVDGAYGASAALGRRSGDLLAGLGRADSLVLDPHKWMFQPFEIGAVLVRDKTLLAEAFRAPADYMQDAKTTGQEINFCDYGIQLSRGFRALKLWVSLQCLGLDTIREAIDRGIVLAETAGREVERDGRFEVTSSACLGIVTFRYVGNGHARASEARGDQRGDTARDHGDWRGRRLVDRSGWSHGAAHVRHQSPNQRRRHPPYRHHARRYGRSPDAPWGPELMESGERPTTWPASCNGILAAAGLTIQPNSPARFPDALASGFPAGKRHERGDDP